MLEHRLQKETHQTHLNIITRFENNDLKPKKWTGT